MLLPGQLLRRVVVRRHVTHAHHRLVVQPVTIRAGLQVWSDRLQRWRSGATAATTTTQRNVSSGAANGASDRQPHTCVRPLLAWQ